MAVAEIGTRSRRLAQAFERRSRGATPVTVACLQHAVSRRVLNVARPSLMLRAVT